MIIYAVDDETNNIELLKEYLSDIKPKASISYFLDPLELLKAEDNKPCDVAILDIRMPGLTGIELAKRIKEIKYDTNIIFLTAYDRYAIDAISLYASGYILKPINKPDIIEQLENLRYPIKENNARAITFGNFDFIVGENHVKFGLKKSKELLAYLIDRRGSVVSRKEIASILFEDGSYSRNQQKKLSQIIKSLKNALEKHSVGGILRSNKDGYYVDTSLFSCDLYEYIEKRYKSVYSGEYMEQYSWGETMKSAIK